MPKDVDSLRVPTAPSAEKAGAGWGVLKPVLSIKLRPLKSFQCFGGVASSFWLLKPLRREDDSSDESEQGEMDEDEEEEIPLDMEVRSCFWTERWSSFFCQGCRGGVEESKARWRPRHRTSSGTGSCPPSCFLEIDRWDVRINFNRWKPY